MEKSRRRTWRYPEASRILANNATAGTIAALTRRQEKPLGDIQQQRLGEQPVDQHAGHRARRHRQHATHGDHRQPQGTTSTAHLLLTQQSLALVSIQTGT